MSLQLLQYVNNGIIHVMWPTIFVEVSKMQFDSGLNGLHKLSEN